MKYPEVHVSRRSNIIEAQARRSFPLRAARITPELDWRTYLADHGYTHVVYILTHTKSGRPYIGSTSDPTVRLWNHIRDRDWQFAHIITATQDFGSTEAHDVEKRLIREAVSLGVDIDNGNKYPNCSFETDIINNIEEILHVLSCTHLSTFEARRSEPHEVRQPELIPAAPSQEALPPPAPFPGAVFFQEKKNLYALGEHLPDGRFRLCAGSYGPAIPTGKVEEYITGQREAALKSGSLLIDGPRIVVVSDYISTPTRALNVLKGTRRGSNPDKVWTPVAI